MGNHIMKILESLAAKKKGVWYHGQRCHAVLYCASRLSSQKFISHKIISVLLLERYKVALETYPIIAALVAAVITRFKLSKNIHEVTTKI